MRLCLYEKSENRAGVITGEKQILHEAPERY